MDLIELTDAGHPPPALPPPPAFEAFYRSARHDCLRAVIAATGDPATAEDCTAEAFARALARWDDLRVHPAPRAWVVRTAVNLHRDAGRRARRGLRLLPRLAVPEATAAVTHDLDPALLAALRALPERQRHVVALRVLLGLSAAQTAATLAISEGAVGTHLHRALAALRASGALAPHRPTSQEDRP